MVSEIKETIIKVVHIPKDSRQEPEISIASRLHESGYYALHSLIDETQIGEALDQYPYCIDHWLQWSADKKTITGWYFMERNEQRYFVGFFPDHFKGPGQLFSDVKIACAYYIKKEIEECRLRYLKAKK